MSDSGYAAWRDVHGTNHLTLTLTSEDARRMDSVQLRMLADAGKLIELAFDPDTPARLAELRAAEAKGGPRRVADLSADELRDVLARMAGG